MGAKQVFGLGLLVVVGLAAGAGAGAAYYWQRATAVPTWHTPSKADTHLVNSLSRGSGSLLQTKLATGEGVRYDGNRVEIVLSEAELNQLVVEGLAQSPQTAALLQVAESVSATVEGNRVRGGLVISPADLPTENLPPQAQQAVQQALATVPMLGDRPLYLGIEGSPRIENGRLVLSDDTRIQVGRLNLTVTDVARLTGIDPAQLNEVINLTLPEVGLTLDGLEFVNGEAVLRGVTQ
jgi:hypothetical protein